MASRASSDDIDAAAGAWVWRLDREGRSPALEAELANWRAMDVRHEGAWLRAQAVWSMLDRASELAPEQVLGFAPARRVKYRSPILTKRRVLIGAGSSLAAAVAAGFYLATGPRYATGVGEVRRVPLKDGSTADINTASAMEVAFNAKIRRVKLRRGEAWFQVAKVPGVPFVVEAGTARVRAVGTAFSVRLREDGVDVLVSEGVVEAWREGHLDQAVRISGGSRAFIATAAVRVDHGGPSEIDRALAWRGGRIDLGGETLATSVAEFNRYNDRQIVLTDPSLATERLYGVFRTDAPVLFAQSVGASLGVSIDLDDPREIRIGRAPRK